MNISKTLQSILCATAIAGSLQAQAPTPVRIDNAPASPVIHREATSKFSRVQFQLNIVPGQPVPQWTVPAGKMLVIEHVAWEIVESNWVTADLKISLGGWTRTYPVMMEAVVESADSIAQNAQKHKIFWGSQEGPFFAKGSWSVSATVHAAGFNYLGGRMIVSGYLRDNVIGNVN
jgi:hypothetical protein